MLSTRALSTTAAIHQGAPRPGSCSDFTIDALTALVSRGSAEAHLGVQLEAEQALTAILVDLDRFKQVNRRWGHLCGDQILKDIARVLAEYSEKFDIICRWEGDKFLMISKSDQKDLEEELGTLRIRLCKPYRGSADVDINASIGVAQAKAGDTVGDLLARAEADLYRSRQGSDQKH